VLKNSGYTGDNWILAGHSIGGDLTQEYLNSNNEEVSMIKSQILMGSAINRSNRKIQDDGKSHIDQITTLQLGGSRDGVMRISRMAESYYHQVKNVDHRQASQFPVVVFKGLAHHSFMNGVPSQPVQDNDLSSSVTAH